MKGPRILSKSIIFNLIIRLRLSFIYL